MLSRAFKVALSFAALVFFCLPSEAHAQSIIRQPGNHPDYAFELEPHLAFQWADRAGLDDGFGAGVRFNIPFMHNGPIPTINNNIGITFGLDVTFGGGGNGWCYGRYDQRFWINGESCHVTEFWLPVAAQWNFFLTKVISVFGEPGLAIVHRRTSYRYYCDGNAGALCDNGYSTNDLEPVFSAGGRFMFSDKVGATVRIGVPMLSAGINILF
jgi:hypothetical protein